LEGRIAAGLGDNSSVFGWENDENERILHRKGIKMEGGVSFLEEWRRAVFTKKYIFTKWVGIGNSADFGTSVSFFGGKVMRMSGFCIGNG
jgi:hypothetical protein